MSCPATAAKWRCTINQAPSVTKPDQNTALTDPINLLPEHGLADGLPRIAEMLMHAAMCLERSAHLRAQPHQRTESRNGYSNGFKPPSLNTSLGKLHPSIPQVRESSSPVQNLSPREGFSLRARAQGRHRRNVPPERIHPPRHRARASPQNSTPNSNSGATSPCRTSASSSSTPPRFM